MFSLDISDLYRVHINSKILFPFQPSMMKKNQEPRTKIKKLGTQNVERGTRNTERGTLNAKRFHFPQISSITFGKCSYSSLCTFSAIISGVSVGDTGHVA